MKGGSLFLFLLNPEHQSDTVCFSYLGYMPVMVPVSEMISMPNFDVRLMPTIYDIGRIAITTKNKRTIRGNNFKTARMQAVVGDTMRGFEIGTLVKFKKRSRIESIKINVRDCSRDSMIFRVNI